MYRLIQGGVAKDIAAAWLGTGILIRLQLQHKATHMRKGLTVRGQFNENKVRSTGAEYSTERLKGGANESQGQSDLYRELLS